MIALHSDSLLFNIFPTLPSLLGSRDELLCITKCTNNNSG